ncbi:MAG: thymidine phosphorylase [Thermoleophilia bacterium]|nr:thymidine phosphorylase [Thermoleophilia bacterium]
MPAPRAVDLIAAKRRGETHSRLEIDRLVAEYVAGRLPDYQMAAWLMAVCFRGLCREETVALTRAMVASGDTVDLSAVGSPVADKHSTGGVGDKVTLVLAPLVAACGLPFAKMSGRGLGHTGGTIDKLESIPGFRTRMSVEEFRAQVEHVGVAVIGQTEGLVPADGLLYALRDVTGTVDQESLIASSIMSKKIAAGAGAIVLDVKVGEGAFLRTEEDALRLARLMVELGTDAGLRVRCVLTTMDEPLGCAVGNAVEVDEAFAVLRGAGPPDVREVALTLAGHLLQLAGLAATAEAGRATAGEKLGSGVAYECCRRWMAAQGADPAVVDGPGLPRAQVIWPVRSRTTGWVQRVHALPVARAGLLLGAGRESKRAAIDPAAGVVLTATRGWRVTAGDILAHVHAGDEAAARAVEHLIMEAFDLAPDPPVETQTVRTIV